MKRVSKNGLTLVIRNIQLLILQNLAIYCKLRSLTLCFGTPPDQLTMLHFYINFNKI
jgi:hypothetical protein